MKKMSFWGILVVLVSGAAALAEESGIGASQNASAPAKVATPRFGDSQLTPISYEEPPPPPPAPAVEGDAVATPSYESSDAAVESCDAPVESCNGAAACCELSDPCNVFCCQDCADFHGCPLCNKKCYKELKRAACHNISPCNFPRRYQYPPAFHGYYYFRPYNYRHIAEHQCIAERWGADPSMPYATNLFATVYVELKVSAVPRVLKRVAPPVEPAPKNSPADFFTPIGR